MTKDISDDDKALFRDQMKSVTPLKDKNKKIHHVPLPPAPIKVKKQASIPSSKPQELFLSDYISEPVQSHSILSYAITSLPTQRFKALKNGSIPWEAKLDLHGLNTDSAREALYQFISQQVEEQKRCVLIVHGRGEHEKGTPPVIKNLTNRWLPQFDQVLAFHSALPKDGGYGAVYVLLKRMKI